MKDEAATSRSAGDVNAIRDMIIGAREAEDVANRLRCCNMTQVTEIYEIIQRECEIILYPSRGRISWSYRVYKIRGVVRR
jgi:hypothetical protein